MGSCVHLILLIGIFFSLVGNLIGLTGYSWWTTGQYEHGLWRYCHHLSGGRGHEYHTRDNLLHQHGEYYVATLLLAISTLFLIISAICTTVVYFDCCFDHRSLCRRFNSVVCVVSVCGSVVSGFGALVYVELSLAHNFAAMTRGWSSIGCWVGYGVGVVLFVVGCGVKVKQNVVGSSSVNIVHVEPVATKQVRFSK